VRAAGAVNKRGTAVAQGVVVRVAAVRVYGNPRSKFRNGRGGGVVGGAIAIVSILNAFEMSLTMVLMNDISPECVVYIARSLGSVGASS
jgi:hypothetical protein